MTSIGYKNYEILAIPRKLPEEHEWKVEILILSHAEEKTMARSFDSEASYANKEEAIQRCFDFGKQVIDGQVKNRSVADL